MVRLTVETENEEWEVVVTSQKYAATMGNEAEAVSQLIKRVGQMADALLDEAEVAEAVREFHSKDAAWTEQHEMAEFTPPDGYLG